MAKHIIFVNLLLKMPLALFQLARSAKPYALANRWKKGLGIYFFNVLHSLHECVNRTGQSISPALEC